MLGGYAARAFQAAFVGLTQAGDAKNAALARQFLIDSWTGMVNVGIETTYMGTTVNGLWYGRTFANCFDGSDPQCNDLTAPGTPPGKIQASRFLAAETMAGCAAAYLQTFSSTLKAACDSLETALVGAGGTNDGAFGGDANYLWGTFGDLGMVGDTLSTTPAKAKDFGFFCGVGLCGAWPGARNVQR